MKFNVLQYSCHTRYGQNIWDILSGESAEDQPVLIRLELLKDFLEAQPQLGRIVCSPEIAESLLRFDLRETELFPEAFDDFINMINNTPTWFLAGSESESSLIACKIQRSDSGFTLVEDCSKTTVDGLFVIGSDWPPAARHCFDLRALRLTREQKWVLSLIGAAEIVRSDLFKCKRVQVLGGV